MPRHFENDKVLVFGTFDRLHPGHRYFLRRAKKLGKKLIVVVSRDQIVLKQKGRRPAESELKRVAALKKIKFINKILLGNKKINHNYQMVQRILPNTICLGYDQPGPVKKIRRQLRRQGLNTNVIRLKSFFPKRYKSSLLGQNRTYKPLP